MRSICLYFQVHQPYRLRTYRFFDIGHDSHYYDEYQNRDILNRVAQSSYLPVNEVLLELFRQHGQAFRMALSISGTAIDQFEAYAPEVLDSFRKLADTGQVEFLAETYDHSLASLRSKDEFIRQVRRHQERIEEVFGVKPVSFRNTELLYSDGIGEMVSEMGFTTMLTEGAKHILGWKSPNFMYCNAINPKLKVMLRNFNLSDDLSFRFSERAWNEWPLTAAKFAGWLNETDPDQELVNVFMDYETFGEYQKAETGIIDFLRALPGEVISKTEFRFRLPREAANDHQPVSAIHVPYPVSWADEERDITAWLGNDLQTQAVDALYALEDQVMNCDDPWILSDWERLQASDHFYFMSTKWFSRGEVHQRFNPYPGPYEAFINFMNVLADFAQRLHTLQASKKSSPRPSVESQAEPDEKMKRWSDIVRVEDSLLKRVLKQTDAADWGIVCAFTTSAIREKILANVTRSQQADYRKLEAGYKKRKKSAYEKAKRELLDAIKSESVN